MAASEVDRLLARVRRGLERVAPEEAAAAMRDGALVVDIRPLLQREREGEIPGALVVGRNVLEWRFDPTGANRLPEAADPERRVVVFCSRGYASSLAARSLQELGWRRATDLIGGFVAWAEAGLPVQPYVGPTPDEADGSAPDEAPDERGEL